MEWGYRENDRIGSKDPYSASKGMAELIIRSYNESYFNTQNSNVSVGIARAGNVIGGGDWALDRIILTVLKHGQKIRLFKYATELPALGNTYWSRSVAILLWGQSYIKIEIFMEKRITLVHRLIRHNLSN